MKRIICLLIAFVTIFSIVLNLASCNKPQESETQLQTNETTSSSEDTPAIDDITIRIGSLKGPTSIGLLNLMNSSEVNMTSQKYSFVMETQGSTLSAMMVQGTLDIALVPANLAANLYNKTNGNIIVVDINTLGVLYCVTGDESIKSMADLQGKTIVTTGQGTTPEFAIKYLMSELKIDDYTLEFKSEATEVAAVLKADPSKIAILPQPFVTVATNQNKDVKVAFSLNDEWNKTTENTTKSKLVTGVTIVRKEFYEQHKDAVLGFIAEHKLSVRDVTEHLPLTAALMVRYEIIANVSIAEAAIPYCNVVCITGEDMKTQLSGYLQTLYNLAPASIGGEMPKDDFYLK